MLHQNSQKRIYGKNKIYFITFYPKNRYKFFQETVFCQILFNVLKFSQKFHDFKFYGIVILFEHVHLMVRPISCDISKLTAFLKRHSSRYNNVIIKNNFDKLHESGFHKSTSSDPSESRNNSIQFQKRLENLNSEQKQIVIWMEQKMKDYNYIYQKKYVSSFLPKFQWQRGFHDHIIRNENDFLNHLNYIKINPTKHKLVKSEKHWPWIIIKK